MPEKARQRKSVRLESLTYAMAGSAALSLRGLPAAERRKFIAWRRQPQGKGNRERTTSFVDLSPKRGRQMNAARRSPGCDQTPPVMVPLPPPSGLGILTGRVGIPGADAARLCTCAPFGAGKGPATKVGQAWKARPTRVAPKKKQRADKELKAPPPLRGSAMVARPTRPQIFAVN
jgi:hypothetical protein